MAEDSPTAARRRVRLVLREAREQADLTQLQVADEMEWSLSKVIRIENGDVSISPNDLRPLLDYLGVKDRAQIKLFDDHIPGPLQIPCEVRTDLRIFVPNTARGADPERGHRTAPSGDCFFLMNPAHGLCRSDRTVSNMTPDLAGR